MPSFTDAERVVTRDGMDLHCRDEGDGPPVVVLARWSLPEAAPHELPLSHTDRLNADLPAFAQGG